MTASFEFRLVPIERLRIHEKVDGSDVRALADEIRRSGVFDDPIWVARDSWVILNGHHRVEALRQLGAKRVPAWVFDYQTDVVRVTHWRRGHTIPKSEVVRRGSEGRPFPPKTTRHRITVALPTRTTPLEKLLD